MPDNNTRLPAGTPEVGMLYLEQPMNVESIVASAESSSSSSV